MVFDDHHRIHAIHFANRKIFASYVFNMQSKYMGNDCINDMMSLTDENMDDQNYVMIWDLFNINLNDKKILNAIINHIQNELNIDVDTFRRMADNYKQCVDVVERILLDLPFEVEVKRQFVMADFAKMLTLKVVDTTSDSLMDKVLKLIDITAFTKNCELVVFVNLKMFFDEEELVEIYKYAVYNGINILILESSICERSLAYEQVLYIDNDFEEFEF